MNHSIFTWNIKGVIRSTFGLIICVSRCDIQGLIAFLGIVMLFFTTLRKKTAFLPYKNYIQMYFFINENVMGDCHGRWTAVISDTFRLGSHDVIVDTFSLSALFRTLKPHANKCFSDLGLRKKSCRKTTVNTTRIKPFI